MVTKGYQKGVYERVTLGIGVETGVVFLFSTEKKEKRTLV